MLDVTSSVGNSGSNKQVTMGPTITHFPGRGRGTGKGRGKGGEGEGIPIGYPHSYPKPSRSK